MWIYRVVKILNVRQHEEELQQREQKLIEENKRLKEALDASEKHLMTAERHLSDFKKFEFEERTEKERLREALETINRRTMSQYLSVDNMVMDFKRIARKALEGDKQ